MKENSIEEDINRCNKLTETTNANWIGISNQLAIRHILSDYKRVLEMNKILLKENELLRQQNISYKNNIYELKEVGNK